MNGMNTLGKGGGLNDEGEMNKKNKIDDIQVRTRPGEVSFTSFIFKI